MTNMLGGHGVTAAALNTLRWSLPAAIATLNAEPGAVQLPEVSDTYVVPYGLTSKPVGPTIVEVSAPATEGRQPNIPTSDADARAMVSVVITMTEQRERAVLAECLHRYATAVVSILAAPDSCGLGTALTRWTTRVIAADIDPDNTGRIPTSKAFVGIEVEWNEALALS